jgi:hypothetical protein
MTSTKRRYVDKRFLKFAGADSHFTISASITLLPPLNGVTRA